MAKCQFRIHIWLQNREESQVRELNIWLMQVLRFTNLERKVSVIVLSSSSLCNLYLCRCPTKITLTVENDSKILFNGPELLVCILDTVQTRIIDRRKLRSR